MENIDALGQILKRTNTPRTKLANYKYVFVSINVVTFFCYKITQMTLQHIKIRLWDHDCTPEYLRNRIII